MEKGPIPFKFDLSDVLSPETRARFRVGNVTLRLPFVSIAVSPDDREKRIAREVIIRLRDKRVLSAQECCDDCIDKALASLIEIRKILVDKQVELSDLHDGGLYLLLDLMLVGIRQFMTFEEVLRRSADAPPNPRFENLRLPEHRQGYFDGLELLRKHLNHCLAQVASLAEMSPPTEGILAQYAGAWDERLYLPPPDTPPSAN